ncbi:uncharacterized protein LOC141850316 [Brevipalpus obovatus]|uniref:uncharacterized protein LOC141850316 n=1 Tax=Brevipalpus obovatus TaxID=246614 RepID=UPI003D9F2F8D
MLKGQCQEYLLFKFIELRKLSVGPISQQNDIINNVCISHAHQVAFVAFNNVLRVIKLPVILDFEWSKNVINQVAENYLCFDVQLPFIPSLLSVSGGKNDHLLVFGQDANRSLCGDLYYIPNLLSDNHNPVNTIDFPPALSQNAKVTLVAWHPEFSESLLALITSTGSLVCIGIDSQTRGVQILSQYSDSSRMTCLAWSPKGKQLVTGAEDGTLTQFKHQNGRNFSKAKSIPLPNDLSGFKCISVNWVHTALFQVAYCNLSSGDSSPDSRIVFIHAAPKTTPEYYDFGSICMDAKPYSPSEEYRVGLSQIGNILLCSTSHSSEIGVIGTENKDINPQPNTWTQWVLDDTSRIELQPMKNNTESVPLGVAWYRGPTKSFRVSESCIIGGDSVPLILILSSSGVLCPYYALHSQNRLTIPDQVAFQPLPISLPPPLPKSRPKNIACQITSFSEQPSAPVTLSSSAQDEPNVSATFTMPLPKSQQPTVAQQTQQSQPQQQPQQQPQPQPQPQPQQQPQQQPPFQPQSCQTQGITASTPQVSQQKLSAAEQKAAAEMAEQKKKEEEKLLDEAMLLALQEEIDQFTQELQKAEERFKPSLSLTVGNSNEMMKLQEKTNAILGSLNKYVNQLKEMDLETLNGFLLETYAMAQDAKTRVDRENDCIYNLLNSKRALDPATARKMREIRRKAKDIETQLDETNSLLDHEWEEFNARISGTSKQRKIPSSIELIYQTLSINHKTISILQKRLKKLKGSLVEGNLSSGVSVGISPRRKEMQDMLEMLKRTTLEEIGYRTKSFLMDDGKDPLIENKMQKCSISSSNLMKSSVSKGLLLDSNLHARSKNIARPSEISEEKLGRLIEVLDQRSVVPVRRAVLPIDIKSSKMVSAIVKAKDKLEEMRAKEKPIYEDITPEKLSNEGVQTPTLDDDRVNEKSLLYSTALQDFSRSTFNTAESPICSDFGKNRPLGSETFAVAPRQETNEASSSVRTPSISKFDTTLTNTDNRTTDSNKSRVARDLSKSLNLTTTLKELGESSVFSFPSSKTNTPDSVLPIDKTQNLSKPDSTTSIQFSQTSSSNLGSTFPPTDNVFSFSQNAQSPSSSSIFGNQPVKGALSFSNVSLMTTLGAQGESDTTKPSPVKPQNPSIASQQAQFPVPASSSANIFTSNSSSRTTAAPTSTANESITSNVSSSQASSSSLFQPTTISSSIFSVASSAASSPLFQNKGGIFSRPSQNPPEDTQVSAGKLFSLSESSNVENQTSDNQESDVKDPSESLDLTSTLKLSEKPSSSPFSSTNRQPPSSEAVTSQPSNIFTGSKPFSFTLPAPTTASTVVTSTPIFPSAASPPSTPTVASTSAPSLGSIFTSNSSARTSAPTNVTSNLIPSTVNSLQTTSSSSLFQPTTTSPGIFSAASSTASPPAFPSSGGPFSRPTQFPSEGSPSFPGSGLGQSVGFGALNRPAFGAAPTFGGTPSFGSAPSFGGLPSFGSAAGISKPFGSSIFGNTAQPSSSPASNPAQFSGFATAPDAPSFGALASQQAPTFGQLATGAQPQPASPASPFPSFGQSTSGGNTSLFGNTYAAQPSFSSPQFSQRRQ